MREPPWTSPRRGSGELYRDRWKGWVSDPLIERAGLTFDRSRPGPILAPTGKFRVCAYHIDFDERPTCWLDVETLAEAIHICLNIGATSAGWNVDYAVAFDEEGKQAAHTQQGG